MVDSEDDFGSYIDNLAAAEEAAARDARMFNEHEIWRQTTWGGWTVRQAQALAQHFKPFAIKVAEMTRDDKNLGSKLFLFFLRILVIVIAMAFLVLIGRVISFLIGGDIIREEEVVVVHEYDTEEAAAKGRAAMSRGKKSKQRKKEE